MGKEIEGGRGKSEAVRRIREGGGKECREM